MSDTRAELKAATSQAIGHTMTLVAGDAGMLARVVADGPSAWRNSVKRSFAGWPVDDAMADRMFAFFADRYLRQFGDLRPGVLLDALDPGPSPPTEKEIAESWEVESGSSEAGRRAVYGADGHPQELLDRFKRGD